MLKVAVIGSGRMGEIYSTLLNTRTDAKLVGVVGNTVEKTLALSKKLNTKAYPKGDIQSLFNDTPELDAIVLASPEWEHLGALKFLIPTGKKILIEKPVVTSNEELEEIERIAKDFKQNLSVVHSLRFSPRFSQAKQVLSQREIGDVRHLYARRNGCQRTVKRVFGKTSLAYWLTCHDVDLMHWFIQSEVEWVFARTRNKLQSEDDYLIAHLHFKNGVDAVEEISWCTPSLSAAAPGCVFSVRGTKGSLEVDDSDMNVTVFKAGDHVSHPDTSEFYPIAGKHYGTFANMIDLWIQSIQNKKIEFPVNFDDGARAVRVCSLIEESVKTGKPVYA